MRISIKVGEDEIPDAMEKMDAYLFDNGFSRTKRGWRYEMREDDNFRAKTVIFVVGYENGTLELNVVRPVRVGCAHYGGIGDFPDSDLFLFGIPPSVGYSCEIKP